MGQHLGIQQVRVDLAAGKALEAPRSLWSGTGLKFPEAPHLYHSGDSWYLVIAEGGTERGHGVSAARGPSPEGPFEGHPANPVLSARSTSRPIQNTGHADLVATPDGGTALVLLGVRPLGLPQSFSPLGRETFITPVSWAGGWPQPEPVLLAPRDAVEEEVFDFADPNALEDLGWLAVRTTPESVASVTSTTLGCSWTCLSTRTTFAWTSVAAVTTVRSGSSIGAPRHEIRQKETPASNSAISVGPFLLGCEQWKASDEPLKRAQRRGAAIS